MWRSVLPDLRQLRTFVAVAEELNFTRAAERLHLAQQAVSKSVRQLERELGVELLQRTTREVRLTPAGAALLQHGREALAAADTAFSRAREIGLGLAGTVRVGVTPAVGPGLRDEIVRALRDGAPELGVALLEVRPRDVARLLHDRELDVVVGRAPSSDPEVDGAALRPSRLRLAAPDDHPLAASDGPVRLAALDATRLLVWNPPGTPFTDLLLGIVGAHGAEVVPVESPVTGGQSLTLLHELDAVALVPEDWPGAPGVTLRDLSEPAELPVQLLWAAGTPPAAAARIRAAMT